MKKHILLASKFCQGKYENDIDGEIWRDAFKYMIRNLKQMSIKKSEIHSLWTVNGGHIRRKIKDDDLVLAVLMRSLPRYSGDGLTLYRGECQFLYKDVKIGFCWTPDMEVATIFASGLNALESGGILLKAYASPSAILAGPNAHSMNRMREFEYTCNPRLLHNIAVVRCFEKPHRT
jgi:hypothetical protein